jgi:PAS domain S-box-containing protein
MKIIVADDSRGCRLLLGTVLNRWGYAPVTVEDGEQAWEALSVPTGPQLAILDWEMPRADGVTVCRRIRAANLSRYVYLVLLTAKSQESDLLAGLEAGADDYLAKPVNLHQLRLRLRAAERVLIAERRHRLMAEVASDGIMTMSAEGAIQFANNSAAAIFGSSVDELMNDSFSKLVPGFSGSIHLPDSEASVYQPGPRVRSWAPVELFGRHRTGKLISLEISFAESVEGAQQPLITAVIRNVTERKVRDTQRAHAQKLESIGGLAAGVAHEINTPIQYIGDNLRFAQSAFRDMQRMVNACLDSIGRLDSSPAGDLPGATLNALAQEIDIEYLSQQVPQALQEGIEGAQRVAEIVKALREFSHPGGAEAAPVDLNHLIEGVALISKNRWKYVADLTLQLDDELPQVKCLAGELNQVFVNLIVNAADAVAEAFRDRPEEKGKLLIISRRDGDFAEVRVCDNGTGIPKAAQSKVFDPFFTTKPVGSGTGQGLSIAYAIITHKHRGSIEFETEVGVGTSFIVRLPIDGAKAPGRRDGAKRGAVPRGSLRTSGATV